MSNETAEKTAFYVLLFLGGVALIRTVRASTAYGRTQQPVTFPNTQIGPIQKFAEILVPMNVSADGKQFIKNHEGLRLQRYSDGSGNATIGWGHRILPSDNIGQSITQAQAQTLFDGDIDKVNIALNSDLKVAVTQNQFDAMADLAFNIGVNAFANSTLLRMINNGNISGASQQFARWNRSGGQVNTGLQNRRADETSLFNSGATS